MSNIEGERLLEEMERAMAGEELPKTVDLDIPHSAEERMERLRSGPTPMPSTPPVTSVSKYEQPAKVTATQGIARDVTRLTWREAEVMGRSIEEKMKGKDGKALSVTQAIQDWAWAWQTFKEEEQPK